MHFNGHAILLDIEGTTSSVQFVYDVLFPYADRHLESYLQSHTGDPQTLAALDLVAKDAGQSSFEQWMATHGTSTLVSSLPALCQHLRQLMRTDAKATGLKQVQGLIWREGYHTGELKSHVYPDVPVALRAWAAAGFDVRIFSSGSVEAQQQFFAHTEAGDLLSLFRGHYDTRIGSKRDPQSYRAIAQAFGRPPMDILFVSDIVAELDAARQADMQTCLSIRPGNAPVPAGHGHPEVSDFTSLVAHGCK